LSPFFGNQLSKTETKGNASIVESYTYDSIGRLDGDGLFDGADLQVFKLKIENDREFSILK